MQRHSTYFLLSVIILVHSVQFIQSFQPASLPKSELQPSTELDRDLIQQIVDIFGNLTVQQFNQGVPWLRQAHAKQHGCVQAIVRPLPNLPSSLAQGVFANATAYPAFIRFSNGVGRGFTPVQKADEPDWVPDIRGLGIKLLNVSGPFITPNVNSQVFTLTTDDVTFLPDIPTALGFFIAAQKGTLAFAAWLAAHPHIAVLFASQAVVISDLLTQSWWSPVPQMHGPFFVKHHMYPCPDSQVATRELSPRNTANYLRDQLISDLASRNACFRWAVQFYEDENTTPINDATVPWPTPFYDLAEIDIPAQTSWNDAQDAFCRFMSFNPGSSISGHAPIGPIPTIRNAVYAAMATLRHKLHGQPARDVTYQDWLNYPYLE